MGGTYSRRREKGNCMQVCGGGTWSIETTWKIKKNSEISWLVEELLDSQEGFCFMELNRTGGGGGGGAERLGKLHWVTLSRPDS
jgi:hypothetical protein